MASYPVVEHGSGRPSRWLRERRFKIALAIGLVEALLVLASAIGWFWVLGAAILAFALYLWVRSNVRSEIVRELTWILAFSQVVPFVVPLLWGLVKLVAVLVLVVLAIAAVGLLLLDHRRR
jgi:hypothetical protein